MCYVMWTMWGHGLYQEGLALSPQSTPPPTHSGQLHCASAGQTSLCPLELCARATWAPAFGVISRVSVLSMHLLLLDVLGCEGVGEFRWCIGK